VTFANLQLRRFSLALLALGICAAGSYLLAASAADRFLVPYGDLLERGRPWLAPVWKRPDSTLLVAWVVPLYPAQGCFSYRLVVGLGGKIDSLDGVDREQLRRINEVARLHPSTNNAFVVEHQVGARNPLEDIQLREPEPPAASRFQERWITYDTFRAVNRDVEPND
jgi:hypothetical protein